MSAGLSLFVAVIVSLGLSAILFRALAIVGVKLTAAAAGAGASKSR